MDSNVIPETSLFLAGAWRPGEGALHSVINPATGETMISYRGASDDQVDQALQAAREAVPGVRAVGSRQRGLFLRRLACAIDSVRDQLARLLVAEVGKPVAQAREEVAWARDYIDYVAEWDRRIEGELVPSDRGAEMIALMRVPVGVVGAICPWNFPLALFARKFAPAFLAGNAVVLKPSELTPLTTLQAAGLLETAAEGMPRGSFSLLLGDGRVGSHMATSRMMDMVTFTGHRDTGRVIAAAAGANLTRVSLELGGKAPVLVAADADLDIAVEATVKARHANTGQVCTCAERVFVADAVYEEFVRRYVDSVEALTIGDPNGDVDLGPLVSGRQLEKVASAIEVAEAAGAQVVSGGAGSKPLPGPPTGNWFRPAVIVNVEPAMSIMQEETFGPVTPIMACRDVEEALRLANDSVYGLSAYVFTNDYSSAFRAADGLSVGEIYINRTSGEAVQAHHSGYRQSGIGGEDGKHGLLKYTQLKTVYFRF